MTTTIPSTSTVEHSPLLQPNRSSIQVTTGERTAMLKIDTKIRSRTLPIEASADMTATATATSKSVLIDIETSTTERLVFPAPEEDSATVTGSSYRVGRMTYRWLIASLELTSRTGG